MIPLVIATASVMVLNFTSDSIRQEFDGVSFAQYVFEGRPIWSDEEKYDIILNHNKELTNLNFSTNATGSVISDKDFIPISDRAETIEVTTTVLKMSLRTGQWGKPYIKKEEVLGVLNDLEAYKKYIKKWLGVK